MGWAISPRGVGRPVGARRIREGWPLAEGEMFTVEHWDDRMVLAEDGQTLRQADDAELALIGEERRQRSAPGLLERALSEIETLKSQLAAVETETQGARRA